MPWPTLGCEDLIDAMVIAEGGPDAFVRAVKCSVATCKDFTEARGIAANTIAHALWDYALGEEGEPIPTPRRVDLDGLVAFLGARWAPVGAGNDPTGLNANWVGNVMKTLRRT